MAYHVNDDIPTKITMVHRDSCKEAQVRTKLPQNGKWYEYLSEKQYSKRYASLV